MSDTPQWSGARSFNMRIKASPDSAFTLVEIMIVVAIIGLLASIAIPSFVKAREKAQQVGCVKNLQTIEAAKQVWATENRKLGTEIPTDDDLFGVAKQIRVKPPCPANGTYTLGSVDEKPACSVTGHSY